MINGQQDDRERGRSQHNWPIAAAGRAAKGCCDPDRGSSRQPARGALRLRERDDASAKEANTGQDALDHPAGRIGLALTGEDRCTERSDSPVK